MRINGVRLGAEEVCVFGVISAGSFCRFASRKFIALCWKLPPLLSLLCVWSPPWSWDVGTGVGSIGKKLVEGNGASGFIAGGPSCRHVILAHIWPLSLGINLRITASSWQPQLREARTYKIYDHRRHSFNLFDFSRMTLRIIWGQCCFCATYVE